MLRCGKCKNCLALERIQRRVLACCNPPFSHAIRLGSRGDDYGLVNLWNTELARLPCLEDDDSWLEQPERYDTDVDGALIDKEDSRGNR